MKILRCLGFLFGGLLASLLSQVPDPDLKPGFPVQSYHDGGTYAAGPGLHALVGNIDTHPGLEIIVTALATGPLYAWKADGTLIEGWPLIENFGAGYPGLGNLSNEWPGCQVFSGYFGHWLSAFSGTGQTLPGWPQRTLGPIAKPPALADVDGDGIDEIFIPGNDGTLHGYQADGTPMPGWPVRGSPYGGQDRVTPAIADLDGDGVPEIVTATSGGGSYDELLAFHMDGSLVAGFPAPAGRGGLAKWLAIRDVDADGELEIVVVTNAVEIFRPNGTRKRHIVIGEMVGYGLAPTLADLNGDDIPEILVQTDQPVHAWYGNGTPFPGWPRRFFGGPRYWSVNSAPVVGDVDGDARPDVVVVTQEAEQIIWGRVWVFNQYGIPHPRFPKRIQLGSGGMAAIADLDLDGRNDIIIFGSYWGGRGGYFDKVWVYDLGGPAHGPIQWGQFGGGPRHQNRYIRPNERAGIEQCKINSVVTSWR